MRKLCTTLSLFLLALALLSTSVPERVSAGENFSGVAIGEKVNDFKLPDVEGKEHTLANLRGKRGTVLIFVSVECPVSNAYSKRMEKLAGEYKARGVNVVGINANYTDTIEMIGEHAAGSGLTFPILKDNGYKVADYLGALVTPEAFFLDGENKLVYRGRIDNSRNESSVTTHDLREAIDATLAGKTVTKTEARAFGCAIKRVA
ncbi:MAG: thioredoxin family protein [Pyrinomonadaceae bacterium]|nr:thioredoxin family protein [Pyrinomonadaceae bacterium]